ncbi:hypothetical protein OS493_028171 [Desmophyllum pertusum]|uniref:Uncharacterized protein n=1 Tax=Desmophyllum pertusum TaxID=174260 RepID=A0A9W9Z9F7_9CNID|nr:hypothetical protein OS493_028171 [Desmophyllum pertusum]
MPGLIMYALTEAERRDDSQDCLVRNNTHVVVPTTVEQRVAEPDEQQSDYQQANGEQSSGPSSSDNETDQAVMMMTNGQEQQSGVQQADGGQVNGLSYSVQETGGHQAQRQIDSLTLKQVVTRLADVATLFRRRDIYRLQAAEAR